MNRWRRTVTLLIVAGPLTVVFGSSGCSETKAGNLPSMDSLLATIADPTISQEALIKALRQLGPATEPASFWTKIANSTEYSPDQRRRAVFELFERHVRPGITVGQLADLLDQPTWLDDADVSVVDRLGGKIPVAWNPQDTIFVIAVFPGLPDGRYAHWAIYLRVSGKVDRESFVRAIQGEATSDAVRGAKVIEYGLSPPDPASVSQ